MTGLPHPKKITGRLAEVAVLAGGDKVVNLALAATGDGHKVVDVELHSLGLATAAVGASEAVSLENGEPKASGNRLAAECDRVVWSLRRGWSPAAPSRPRPPDRGPRPTRLPRDDANDQHADQEDEPQARVNVVPDGGPVADGLDGKIAEPEDDGRYDPADVSRLR